LRGSLAVRLSCQSCGTGTALLTARHHDLDHDGVPAYLEASSPRDLYLCHGYTLRPGGPFCLPEGGPPMCPCGENRPLARRSSVCSPERRA
jgi:hypothetical protein